ncbi:hypothetical protein ES288_A12G123000v1 [Gossypium darwinii]|uniref:Uncharacterized protein n=1 Tax=Gossypium darwinii TaxID=34276 RepID=A0A5D2E8W5_GOSDA|nr:hypothetical protein ES288_A12G123000v1 [Gossypium darwinii]
MDIGLLLFLYILICFLVFVYARAQIGSYSGVRMTDAVASDGLIRRPLGAAHLGFSYFFLFFLIWLHCWASGLVGFYWVCNRFNIRLICLVWVWFGFSLWAPG